MDNQFMLFLETVDERFQDFVTQINNYLTDQGCKCDIKEAKSGYVAFLYFKQTKKDFS